MPKCKKKKKENTVSLIFIAALCPPVLSLTFLWPVVQSDQVFHPEHHPSLSKLLLHHRTEHPATVIIRLYLINFSTVNDQPGGYFSLSEGTALLSLHWGFNALIKDTSRCSINRSMIILSPSRNHWLCWRWNYSLVCIPVIPDERRATR